MVDVAGFLAEDLDEEVQTYGRWARPNDRQTEREIAEADGVNYVPHPRRVSTTIRLAPWEIPGEAMLAGSDFDMAFQKADAICLGHRIQEVARRLKLGSRLDVSSLAPSRDDIVLIIEQAEARAERILKRRWKEVDALARALWRRKSHRMTTAQVQCLLATFKTRRPGHK
jgi:hypothetical protein